jgi:hypothetical protein
MRSSNTHTADDAEIANPETKINTISHFQEAKQNPFHHPLVTGNNNDHLYKCEIHFVNSEITEQITLVKNVFGGKFVKNFMKGKVFIFFAFPFFSCVIINY